MKNLLYHRTNELELLNKKLEDTNVQLVECMRQIQKMAAEKELCNKELEELRNATQVVVDMVDPPEEGVFVSKALLEHLQEAPRKFTS
jgi:hypothetical protein